MQKAEAHLTADGFRRYIVQTEAEAQTTAAASKNKPSARMVKLADTGDSKSPARKGMGVQLPLRAPLLTRQTYNRTFYFGMRP
jgi:hypothetical protein